jgi:hypothetical protein
MAETCYEAYRNISGSQGERMLQKALCEDPRDSIERTGSHFRATSWQRLTRQESGAHDAAALRSLECQVGHGAEPEGRCCILSEFWNGDLGMALWEAGGRAKVFKTPLPPPRAEEVSP